MPETFISDPDCEMPLRIQRIHWEINRSARECYALRNAAECCGDLEYALSLHKIGDVLLERSMAISAEWTV